MKTFASLIVLLISFCPQSAFALESASIDGNRIFCGYLERRIFVVDTFTQLICAFDPGGPDCSRAMGLLDSLLALHDIHCA